VAWLCFLILLPTNEAAYIRGISCSFSSGAHGCVCVHVDDAQVALFFFSYSFSGRRHFFFMIISHAAAVDSHAVFHHHSRQHRSKSTLCVGKRSLLVPYRVGGFHSFAGLLQLVRRHGSGEDSVIAPRQNINLMLSTTLSLLDTNHLFRWLLTLSLLLQFLAV